MECGESNSSTHGKANKSPLARGEENVCFRTTPMPPLRRFPVSGSAFPFRSHRFRNSRVHGAQHPCHSCGLSRRHTGPPTIIPFFSLSSFQSATMPPPRSAIPLVRHRPPSVLPSSQASPFPPRSAILRFPRSLLHPPFLLSCAVAFPRHRSRHYQSAQPPKPFLILGGPAISCTLSRSLQVPTALHHHIALRHRPLAATHAPLHTSFYHPSRIVQRTFERPLSYRVVHTLPGLLLPISTHHSFFFPFIFFNCQNL